jgi:hypothetical protein
MTSQTLLHVSVYQRYYHGAHMILTSYLYDLGLCSTTVRCSQQQSVITTCIHSVTVLTGANLLETPLFFL